MARGSIFSRVNWAVLRFSHEYHIYQLGWGCRTTPPPVRESNCQGSAAFERYLTTNVLTLAS